jgi:hypothetical protein
VATEKLLGCGSKDPRRRESFNCNDSNVRQALVKKVSNGASTIPADNWPRHAVFYTELSIDALKMLLHRRRFRDDLRRNRRDCALILLDRLEKGNEIQAGSEILDLAKLSLFR